MKISPICDVTLLICNNKVNECPQVWKKVVDSSFHGYFFLLESSFFVFTFMDFCIGLHLLHFFAIVAFALLESSF